eukprot:scaffold3821_cov173-Amphora_coffeaeformis.AAC.1
MGDEWEQERYAAMLEDMDMDSSLQSWADVEQVFPTAEQDYLAACQMKEGKRNKATDDLLARVLGLEQLPDHDDDDEVLDKNFDLDSFQKEREEIRKKKRNESDEESEADDEGDDGSSHSSQATLVEMSSVELEVGKAELDALSKASSDDDDDADSEGANRRRSRRLRKSAEETKGKDLVDDIGEFDEANIVEGKRGRKPVDYITLNQAIFGDVPDEDAAVLDDSEEFKQSSRNKAATSEDEGSDAKSDGEEDSVTEEENDDKEDRDSHQAGTDGQESSTESDGDKKKKGVSKSPATAKNGQKRKTVKNGTMQGGNKKPRRNVNKTSSAAKQVSSPDGNKLSFKKQSTNKGKKRKSAQKNGTPTTKVTRSKGGEISKLKKGAASKSNGHVKSAKKTV